MTLGFRKKCFCIVLLCSRCLPFQFMMERYYLRFLRLDYCLLPYHQTCPLCCKMSLIPQDICAVDITVLVNMIFFLPFCGSFYSILRCSISLKLIAFAGSLISKSSPVFPQMTLSQISHSSFGVRLYSVS